MNAIFIWNKNSKEYLEKIVANAVQFKKVDIISSKEEYDKFIAAAFGDGRRDRASGKAKSKQTLTYIYVCVELTWGVNPVYEGYRIGYDLIQKVNLPEFCLCFFSLKKKKDLYRDISADLKFLLKAIPPIDILTINRAYKFPINKISAPLLKFLKTYALLDYGILDNFSHRLKILSNGNAIQACFEEIHLYKEIIGNEINNFLSKVSMFDESIASQLVQLLDKRVAELKGEKVAISTKKFDTQYKLLVLDDNRDDLEIIKKSLKRYYKNDLDFNNSAMFLTSGEEGLKTLKENGDDFDFIITDLELLDDDGFYQKVQGIEIYNYAKNNLNKVIPGIITGYGKKGIESLLGINQEHILPKSYLRKFGIDEEVDKLIDSLLLGYKKREEETFYNVGPKLGIIGKTLGYKTEYDRLQKEDYKTYHDDMWNKAKGFAKMYIEESLEKNSNGWSPETKSPKTKVRDLYSFIREKHCIILAQRLIVLHFYITHDKTFYEQEFEEIAEKFMDLTSYKKDFLISRLGLHLKNIKEIGGYLTCNIEFKNLFPEEREWVSIFEKEEATNAMLIKENSPKVIDWLQNKLGSHFVNENFKNYTYTDLINFLKTILPYSFKQFKNENNNNAIQAISDFVDTRVPASVTAELNKGEITAINKAFEDFEKIINPI